ncbi:hypothetical protein GCM10010468_46460 [Actinocorallia longicatena]|uniref:Uncharacterized protein n=1 Tax=Actinocorallia longicatena TaxID=111803 RepID=A0ABP6QD74_9ACTN
MRSAIDGGEGTWVKVGMGTAVSASDTVAGANQAQKAAISARAAMSGTTAPRPLRRSIVTSCSLPLMGTAGGAVVG